MSIVFTQLDNRDKDWINICKQLNSTYCKINNYDYYLDNSYFDITKYNNVIQFCNSQKEAKMVALMYHKFQLVQQMLKKYDTVVYADSDCVVVNPSIKIQSLIDDTNKFYISKDCTMFATTIFLLTSANQVHQHLSKSKEQYIHNFYDFVIKEKDNDGRNVMQKIGNVFTNPKGVNAGFMIFKKSDIIFQFLNDCKTYIKICQYAQYDQGAIAMMTNSKKYKDIVKIFNDKFQGDSYMPHSDFTYNQNCNFINHICGASDQFRKNAFLQVKKNKWWRQYFK